MSLNDLLAGGPKKEQKKPVKKVKKEVLNKEQKKMAKNIDLLEEDVSILSALAALDFESPVKNRNFKNFAAKLLREYAQANKNKLGL